MSEAPKIKNVQYDENLPVMDREQIEMLLMSGEDEDDTSLVRELFELFEAESIAKLETLAEVCEQGDTQALANMVHFVAGSAGNLGLARLGEFYRAIERAIDQKALTDLSDCARPVRAEFERSRDAFRAEFNL